MDAATVRFVSTYTEEWRQFDVRLLRTIAVEALSGRLDMVEYQSTLRMAMKRT